MADTPTDEAKAAAERAVSTFKSGDMENAVPFLRQAIEYMPDKIELRMYLGAALMKADRLADAESALNKAYELDGGNADAAYLLGVVIAKQGRLREAHSMFHVATLNDPNHEKAKSALDKTAKAAEQVTTDGSSALTPAGLAGLDFNPADFADIIEGGNAGKSGAKGDLGGALDELKQKHDSGGASAGKKAGCGASIMMLVGLASLLPLLAVALVHVR